MDVEETDTDLDDASRGVGRPGTALERFRLVSTALSDAARRKQLSSRRRAAPGGGGFAARRGVRLMRWLTILSFVLFVAIPTGLAGTYYLFVASDVYVSEANFIVASGERPMPDTIASLTGAPLLAIFQDTQIVVNFIHSRAALELLESKVHARELYSDPKADFLARLKPESLIERFVKYWRKMSEVSISMPAGIVQLRISAFTPEGARDLARATVDICESLVNDMNARMNKDAVDNAEQELRRSSERLTAALAALEVARNESGILETNKSADAINALIKEVRLNLLSLQGQYDSQLKNVQPTAPQMRELSSRIEVTKKQLAEMESKLTSLASADASDPTIAKSMTKFGELDLERQVAERLYASAAASLELARVNAESKLMYFKVFVSPVAPEEAQYPRRWLNTFLAFVVSLGAWGLFLALSAMVRAYMS